MVFPFSNHDGKAYNSNLIVNFIEDEGACFETKKRVPYLIYLETVDLEDFKTNQAVFENDFISESEMTKMELLEELDGWEIPMDLENI